MLKKIILLVSCIGFVLIVTACQNDNVGEEDYEPEPPIVNGEEPDIEEDPEKIGDFEFTIDIIDESDFAELGDYQTVNYGNDGGLNLIFNFNQSITSFTIINVLFTNTDINEYGFVQTGEVITVGNVEDVLILTNYWTLGTLPHLGFTFTMPNGTDVWYVFSQSQMDGEIHWQPFHWSRDYDLYEINADTVVVYHTVVASETMFSIARMYGTTVATILELNNLDSYDVSVGQILRMPDGSVKDSSLATHHLVNRLGFDIRIEWLRETVTNYVTFDYNKARGTNTANYDTLLIAPSETMNSFAIIDIDPDPGTGNPEALAVLFYVGDLNPNQPLIISSYFGHGTSARSGFTFIDENGNRRFFFFLQNQADEGPDFIIVEFQQTDLSFLN